MWISRYIYFGGDPYGPEVDRLLVAAIGPLVRELLDEKHIRRYFFIRYSEGGSHIRLRLQSQSVDENETASISSFISNRVRDAVRSFSLSPKPGVERLPDSPTPIIRDVPYEPEAERYGGASGLPIAEELFFVSSEIAFEMLTAGHVQTDPSSLQYSQAYSRRFGHSLLLAVVLASGFFGVSESSSFLKRYSHGYLDIAQEHQDPPRDLRQHLQPDDAVSSSTLTAISGLLCSLHTGGSRQTDAEASHSPRISLVDRWHRACCHARQSLVAAAQYGVSSTAADRLNPWSPWTAESVIASYLHVHHNRLGWSIPQEVHLTHIAANALARIESGLDLKPQRNPS